MDPEIDRPQLHDILKQYRLRYIRSLPEAIPKFPPDNIPKTQQFIQLLKETGQMPPIYKRRFESDAEELENARSRASSITYLIYYGLIIGSNACFLAMVRKRRNKITNFTSLVMAMATTFVLVPLTFWNPIFKVAAKNTISKMVDIETRQQQLIAREPVFGELYAKMMDVAKI